VQYNIPTIVVLFNDNAYGNVMRAQEEQFDGRVIGTKLHNPEFVPFAQSFGVWAKRANHADELGDALAEAVALRRPALIEVPVGPLDRVY
jgi:acetolactate synthase-1/2/3 large subunit